MLLRHATPKKNLKSILRAGLLVSKSTCKVPGVWLHSPSHTYWALIHVAKRHGCRVEDVVVVEVGVPRRPLRHKGRKGCGRNHGLWRCLEDVPAGRLGRVITFADIEG